MHQLGNTRTGAPREFRRDVEDLNIGRVEMLCEPIGRHEIFGSYEVHHRVLPAAVACTEAVGSCRAII